jgi:hypothetical protein
MKFAIYGDSFADARHPNIGNYNRLTWASNLARLMGATNIDYYAQGATPFVFSYRKIMESADQYDRIIVAVTDPYRYTKPVDGHYITGVNNVNAIKNYYIKKQLFGWFYLQDELFMSTIQELMLQQITALYPTAVLVPCFPTSFTAQRRRLSIWKDDVSLCHFGHGAVVQAKVENTTYREVIGSKNILCHIPADWQATVAHIIHHAMETQQAVVVPKNLVLRYPISNYFRPL